jgi:hypothetical protein
MNAAIMNVYVGLHMMALGADPKASGYLNDLGVNLKPAPARSGDDHHQGTQCGFEREYLASKTVDLAASEFQLMYQRGG